MNIHFILLVGTLLSLTINPVQASMIASGHEHSVAIGLDGNVYTWGKGAFGKLGHGDEQNQNSPKKIQLSDDIPSIIAVAAHGRYTALLDIDGGMWIIGRKRALQPGQHYETARKIEGLPPIYNVVGAGDYFAFLDGLGYPWTFTENDTCTPLIPNKLQFNEALPKITDIASGEGHTVFLDVNGEVWTWGDGTAGQLGHRNVVNLAVPKKIENMPRITNIAAGANYTILLDEHGQVWTFGYGFSGQTGHGGNMQKVPTKISSIPKIIAIAAGQSHAALLDENKKVWTFGMGERGIGHGDQLNQMRPKQIEGGLPSIEGITCGKYGTILVDENNTLWTFGALGCGNRQSSPTKIENFMARTIRANNSMKSARK